MATQLSMFQDLTPPVTTKRLPWITIFPDWMPKVGERAQMNETILNGVYCYMDRVIIDSIECDDVVCTVNSKWSKEWNGRVYRCTIYDLWPPIYTNN